MSALIAALIVASGLPRDIVPTSSTLRPQPTNLRSVPDWALEANSRVGWLGDQLAVVRLYDNPRPTSATRGYPEYHGATLDRETGG